MFPTHSQISTRNHINRLAEICRVLDVAPVGRSLHMLRQRCWRLEDLQARGTAMVSALVCGRLEVSCESFGVRKALAVPELARLG